MFCALLTSRYQVSVYRTNGPLVSLYYGNINTNGSESLQTSYDHYKYVAIGQNGLRIASEYVANMRLYEF